ncbi:MAG: RNA polymerase sigma factor [Eubacterium sp.]|nr:RNA polymerase sigma factor [Eubacterium sp.]
MAVVYLDERLILDMADGDKEAFRKIYEATDSTVYGLALSILKNRQDAEDVMHDAYIRIYSGAHSYKPEGKPLAWIVSIVRNLCLNKIREGNRADGFDDEKISEVEDPGDEIEQLTARMVLDAAMDVLDDEEREIVLLHAVTGYRHREIADLMGMPQGTVLSKYNRALRKMKNELNGKEDAE